MLASLTQRKVNFGAGGKAATANTVDISMLGVGRGPLIAVVELKGFLKHLVVRNRWPRCVVLFLFPEGGRRVIFYGRFYQSQPHFDVYGRVVSRQ